MIVDNSALLQIADLWILSALATSVVDAIDSALTLKNLNYFVEVSLFATLVSRAFSAATNSIARRSWVCC